MVRMTDPIHITDSLRVFVLFAFLGLASLRFVLLLLARSAVRDVLLVLPGRRTRLFPWLSTLGLVACVAAALVGAVRDDDVLAVTSAGMGLGMMLWLTGSLLAGRTLVTRHGMVRADGRFGGRVTWSQIKDSFEAGASSGRRFVFISREGRAAPRRFEVHVPDRYVGSFRRLIHHHLHAPRDARLRTVTGHRALEGE